MKINSNSGAAASLLYFSRKLVLHFSLLLSLMLMPFALGGLAVFEAEGTAYAAQGGNGGGGGGGGTGPDKGDLYGDAVYLLRDPDTGVPILINGCIRPVGFGGSQVLALNGDFEVGDYKPETSWENIEFEYGVDWSDCEPDDLAAAKTDPQVTLSDEDSDELEVCDPVPNCVAHMEECDLGRLSMLKAPERVLDRQLQEVITKLDSGEVTLDPSGRPVVNSLPFDSPLLNLALFREFHRWGAIVKNPLNENEEVVYSPGDFILSAAFALGAGDDKEGPGIDREVAVRSAAIIHLGEFIHELELLEPNESPFMGPAFPFSYEGTTTYYVNYDEFTYSRKDTFKGNICYDYFDENVGDYVRVSGSIIEKVFNNDEGPVNGIPALTGFATAANDARRVLVFVHDNLVQFADSVFETTAIDETNCPPLL